MEIWFTIALQNPQQYTITETTMDKIAREQFQARLENEWQGLVTRFQRLPPSAQQAFLARQGYASLSGLLGHVIAWWQDSVIHIEQMRADPALPLPEYDVDAFNARAIEKFGACSESDILQTYAAQRRAMLELVNRLSDAEISQENINTRLYYEIIMHWTEHELGNSPDVS